MGIRYYAYAFEAELTEFAKADPRSFIRDDPLADAWGMPHGARVATTNFEQSMPKEDMLYLDKAWSSLQALSAPAEEDDEPRPAYRMFEGRVAHTEYGWIPWTRALPPSDVVEIADDITELHRTLERREPCDEEGRYVLDYLGKAVEFVACAAKSNRGFAYMIG